MTSTVDNWKRTNGIDYSGVLYTNKHVIEQFLKQGRGGVLANIASMFGPSGRPEQHRLLGFEGRGNQHDARCRNHVREGGHPWERGGPRGHPRTAH